jgi:hypothetical protein
VTGYALGLGPTRGSHFVEQGVGGVGGVSFLCCDDACCAIDSFVKVAEEVPSAPVEWGEGWCYLLPFHCLLALTCISGVSYPLELPCIVGGWQDGRCCIWCVPPAKKVVVSARAPLRVGRVDVCV